MTKLAFILAAGVGAVTFVPQQATAQTCTRSYQKCLNDTWDTEGATRLLADVECAAVYAGCVRKTILGL